MTEKFLHYIWNQELFYADGMKTTSDIPVEVHNTGKYNTDAGPDFTDARIKIGDTLWAGNVEMHLKASDWNKHNHQTNAAYDNVILHVVIEADKEIKNTKGEPIPTLKLSFSNQLQDKYEKLISNPAPVPCTEDIPNLDPFVVSMWLESLLIARLERKTEDILTILESTGNSWEETFYIVFFRNFGFKTNALPFELLAKSLPLKTLSKYSKNLFQLEAILFGQAGFLQDNPAEDEYYIQVKTEYDFLKKLHALTPIDKHLWKFMRLRPVNFPTIRIAQLAWLIHQSSKLFSRVIECQTIQELKGLLKAQTSEYWTKHYNFGKESALRVKAVGESSLDIILINTIIPFIFIYGDKRNKTLLKERALEFLSKLKPEKNTIINNWNDIGIVPKSAGESQALIELNNNFCIQKKCLFCQIGNALIRTANYS